MNHQDYWQYTTIRVTRPTVSPNKWNLLAPQNQFRVALFIAPFYDNVSFGPVMILTDPNIATPTEVQTLTGEATFDLVLEYGAQFPIHGPLTCSEFWGCCRVAGLPGGVIVTEVILDTGPCDNAADSERKQQPYGQKSWTDFDAPSAYDLSQIPPNLISRSAIDILRGIKE